MFSRRTGWKLTPNRFTVVHQEMLRSGREIFDLAISNPTRAGIGFDEAAVLDGAFAPKLGLRLLTARETRPTAAGVAINVRQSEPLPGWYRRG